MNGEVIVCYGNEKMIFLSGAAMFLREINCTIIFADFDKK
jgi:hypothetical protein